MSDSLLSMLMGDESSVTLRKRFVSSNPNIAYVKKDPSDMYELERISLPERDTCVFVLHADEDGAVKIRFEDVPNDVFDSDFELEFVRGGQSGFIVKVKVPGQEPRQFHPDDAATSSSFAAVLVPSSSAPYAGGRTRSGGAWAASPAGKWHALVMQIYRKDGLRSLSDAMKKAKRVWKKR